jgi:glycosyltransferase involved in cell wall biosynthesis
LRAPSGRDKVALLDPSHAVVFPSHLRSEALGIALPEGAVFGKSMISSEVGTGGRPHLECMAGFVGIRSRQILPYSTA